MYHQDKQENVFGLYPAVQEFQFTGDEKGLTKYGFVIEERAFNWSVIDRKIKLLKLDIKKANE